jgi:hypothetical protein
MHRKRMHTKHMKHMHGKSIRTGRAYAHVKRTERTNLRGLRAAIVLAPLAAAVRLAEPRLADGRFGTAFVLAPPPATVRDAVRGAPQGRLRAPIELAPLSPSMGGAAERAALWS